MNLFCLIQTRIEKKGNRLFEISNSYISLIMKIRVRKSTFAIGVMIYFLFNTPYCLGYISDSTVYFYVKMTIGIFLTGLVLLKSRGKIERNLKFGIEAFMIPYFVVTVISFVTGLLVYHLSIKPYITQSFLLLIEQWIIFIFAYYIFKFENENAIHLVTVVGVISYTTVIIHYIYLAGIDGILHPFNNRVDGVGLEVHGLTYMFVLILLYYGMTKGIKYIFRNKLLLLVILYVILGNKRAAYLGAALAIFLYWLLLSFGKKKKIIVTATTVLTVGFLFGYIVLIHSGYLQKIALLFNISDSFRFNFWNYFKKYYTISPSYVGRTIFFTDYYMTLPEIHELYHFSGQGQMHNDILRAYIGWGFLPFLYYYTRLLFVNIKKLEKKNISYAGWKFFPIMCFFIIIEGFDNMMGTLHFNMVVYLIFFLYVSYYDKDFSKARKIK